MILLFGTSRPKVVTKKCSREALNGQIPPPDGAVFQHFSPAMQDCPYSCEVIIKRIDEGQSPCWKVSHGARLVIARTQLARVQINTDTSHKTNRRLHKQYNTVLYRQRTVTFRVDLIARLYVGA